MFEKRVVEEQKVTKEKKERRFKKDKCEAGNRAGKSSGNVGFAVKALVIPFVMAGIAACLIYLTMQNITKNEIVKKSVVCAKTDITANTYVDADSLDKYFEVKEVEADILSKNVYKVLEDMPVGGFYVETNLEALQMVYPNELSKTDEVMDKYVEGTQITSIKVNAFDNSVSGTLRDGDIVDVYAVDPSTDELTLMVSDVYVIAAFDNSGNELTKEYEMENGAGNATVFSVKVAPDEVENMNKAISFGGIQLYVSKSGLLDY